MPYFSCCNDSHAQTLKADKVSNVGAMPQVVDSKG